MITTTTVRELEQAIRARIATITPTHPVDRDGGWVPSDDNDRVLESTLVPRLFVVEVAPGDIVEGGLTGNGDTETSVDVEVVADYRSFQDEDLGSVIEADVWDIHDAFSNGLDAVVPGLTHWQVAGKPALAGDETERRYALPFLAHYMRQR